MRDYTTISPLFWIGETGRALRGDHASQLVALYLVSCPSSNLIGLYHIGIPTICHETGLTEKGALKGLQRGEDVHFAAYDTATETVFVYEMAKYQLGETLKPNDNRIKAVVKALDKMRKSPFYKEFWDRYHDAYHLDESPLEAPSENTKHEAPLKPLRSQEQEQEQEQEVKKAKPPKKKYPDIFDRWWFAYPKERRLDKPATLAAWIKAGKLVKESRGMSSDQAVEFLQRKVEEFAASPKAENPEYVKHSHRWLKAAQYDDDPSAWQNHEKPNGKPPQQISLLADNI